MHLIDHKYSVVEIERMRDAIPRFTWPMYWRSETDGDRGDYWLRPGEREREIERHLRTYMMAGIRPEELEARADAAERWSEQQRLSFRKSA